MNTINKYCIAIKINGTLYISNEIQFDLIYERGKDTDTFNRMVNYIRDYINVCEVTPSAKFDYNAVPNIYISSITEQNNFYSFLDSAMVKFPETPICLVTTKSRKIPVVVLDLCSCDADFKLE